MKDEHDGMGGSYVADPKTGKRRLVECTQQAAAAPPPAAPEVKTEAPAAPAANLKE